MEVLNWLQSINGVFTLTFGGMSLAAIIGSVMTISKNVKQQGVLGAVKTELVTVKEQLKETQKMNQVMLELNEEKQEEMDRMELQRLEENETQKLILQALTFIISAAGGIDDVTKVKFITEMNKAKENIVTKANEIKTMVKEEVAIKTEEFLEKTVEKAEEFLGEAKTKLESVVNKYTKK